MSAQVGRGRTTDPLWKRRARALPVPLAILVVLALLIGVAVHACSGPDDSKSGGLGDAAGSGASFSVSYGGSTGWLEGLDQQERTEQLRDWARFGLATRLGASTDGYRDSSYDTLPVRDRAFDGLARQAYGPGRFLHDGDHGRDTLHVLVPDRGAHRKRTVGEQIDQYRTDAGSDPKRVQVHEYELRPGSASIRISVGKAAKTAKVRAAYGYVTRRVDTAAGLRDFLKRTDRLSSLERNGSKVYAHGWSSGGKPLVDAKDVSVLQRGYTEELGTPGFSLDPTKAAKAEDVRKALPELKPEWADELARGGTPAGLAGKVAGALFRGEEHAGLPDSRAQLWTLNHLLQGGRHAFTQARYEGGLGGTEAGMTLFYTDYVAKHWVAGAGTGNGALSEETGFVTDPEADIPWGQCADGGTGESGRLWFGQNHSAFSYDGDRVDIGAQATRVFARTQSNGREIEPGYAFGRGLRWWDRNYRKIADFEPQYERLDGLMRWGGALDWLSADAGGAELPQLDDGDITSGLRFKDWYAEHDELRERRHIDFVYPPSAREEALQNGASKPFDQCGAHVIKGGVSLADRVSSGKTTARPDVPRNLQRAGEFDADAAFDSATGEGRTKQVWRDGGKDVTDSVERTLGRGEDGSAVVTAKGEGRKGGTLGELQQTHVEGAEREVRSEISGGAGELVQSVETSGQRAGAMRGTRTAYGASVTWIPGAVAKLRTVAHELQQRLAKGEKATLKAADVLYTAKTDGELLGKVAGEGRPWIALTKGDKAADGAVLGLRLGAPKGRGGGVEHSTLALVPGIGGKGPGAPRGPPERYMEVAPSSGGGTPKVEFRNKPGDESTPVTVRTPDGRKAEVHFDGTRARVEADDPVLGLDGSVSGAAFLTRSAEIRSAMKDAERAGDGTFRAVDLGDGHGFALAGPRGEAVLVEPGTAWAGRLRDALGADASAAIRYVKGGEPQYVSKHTLKRAEGENRTMTLDGVYAKSRGAAYASPRLTAQLSSRQGEFPRITPGRKDLTVVVKRVEVVTGTAESARDTGPDGYRVDGEHWTRLGGPPGGGAGGGSGGAGGGSGGGKGPDDRPVSVPGGLGAPNSVYVVCTQDEAEDSDSLCYSGD